MITYKYIKFHTVANIGLDKWPKCFYRDAAFKSRLLVALSPFGDTVFSIGKQTYAFKSVFSFFREVTLI